MAAQPCQPSAKTGRTYFAAAADAVFVAVGKPGLVRGEMLKPGAALILRE